MKFLLEIISGRFAQEDLRSWSSSITADGKQINLGRWNSKFEAVLIRFIAEVEYGYQPSQSEMLREKFIREVGA